MQRISIVLNALYVS